MFFSVITSFQGKHLHITYYIFIMVISNRISRFYHIVSYHILCQKKAETQALMYGKIIGSPPSRGINYLDWSIHVADRLRARNNNNNSTSQPGNKTRQSTTFHLRRSPRCVTPTLPLCKHSNQNTEKPHKPPRNPPSTPS